MGTVTVKTDVYLDNPYDTDINIRYATCYTEDLQKKEIIFSYTILNETGKISSNETKFFLIYKKERVGNEYLYKIISIRNISNNELTLNNFTFSEYLNEWNVIPLIQIPSNYEIVYFENEEKSILEFDEHHAPAFNIDENSINTIRLLGRGTSVLRGGYPGLVGFLDLEDYFYVTFIDLYYGTENLRQRIQLQEFTKIENMDEFYDQVPEGKLIILIRSDDDDFVINFYRDTIDKTHLTEGWDYHYYEITEPDGHFHHFFPANSMIFFHTKPIYIDEGVTDNNYYQYNYNFQCRF